MTNKTRRSFMAVAGAALSAPVAAAAATLPGRIEPDPMKTRLVRLEDVNAIRALSQAYLRHAAAAEHDAMAALFADPSQATLGPDIHSMSPPDFGEYDVIDIAEDRQSATARLHVTVHTQTPLEPDCTLVEMARAQGEGVVRMASPAVLEHTYVRRGGVWKILRTRDARTMA